MVIFMTVSQRLKIGILYYYHFGWHILWDKMENLAD